MIEGSVLLVCTSCRAQGSDSTAPRPGAALLAAVRAAAPSGTGTRGRRHHLPVRLQAALLAPGRVTCLFGDLPADPVSASDLLQAARDHAAAPDGWLPRVVRPARLRTSILARVPPLH